MGKGKISQDACSLSKPDRMALNVGQGLDQDWLWFHSIPSESRPTHSDTHIMIGHLGDAPGLMLETYPNKLIMSST